MLHLARSSAVALNKDSAVYMLEIQSSSQLAQQMVGHLGPPFRDFLGHIMEFEVKARFIDTDKACQSNRGSILFVVFWHFGAVWGQMGLLQPTSVQSGVGISRFAAHSADRNR